MCGINNCKNSFFNEEDDCCTDTCEVGTGKDKDGDTQMQNNLNNNLLRGIMECKDFYILYGDDNCCTDTCEVGMTNTDR